jgi:hypothetical protein
MRVVENSVVCTLAVFTLLLVGAPAAQAQLVIDPRRSEFAPSADHNATASNGTPIVQSYTLRIFVAGNSTPVQTVNLGKPNPAPDGLIRIDFVPLLSSPLQTNVTYEARVSANGPGGSATSTVSNTFSFSAPCTPTISPISQSVTAAGGTGSVTVTAGAGCAWTATSNASWLTVTSGAPGTGAGAVTFRAAANTATTSRTGTLTIAGATFTVTQAAATCSFTVAPLAVSAPLGGGNGTITVTTVAGCAWSSSSGASWVTVSGSGSGSGAASYNVAANTTGAARSTSITVAGRTVTITQPALTLPAAPINVRIIR